MIQKCNIKRRQLNKIILNSLNLFSQCKIFALHLREVGEFKGKSESPHTPVAHPHRCFRPCGLITWPTIRTVCQCFTYQKFYLYKHSSSTLSHNGFIIPILGLEKHGRQTVHCDIFYDLMWHLIIKINKTFHLTLLVKLIN